MAALDTEEPEPRGGTAVDKQSWVAVLIFVVHALMCYFFTLAAAWFGFGDAFSGRQSISGRILEVVSGVLSFPLLWPSLAALESGRDAHGMLAAFLANSLLWAVVLYGVWFAARRIVARRRSQ